MGRVTSSGMSQQSVENGSSAEQQNSDERALGLTADPVSRTFWVYTDKSILEVLVKNEDRDVWRAKLERGDHTGALSFVKVSFRSL